MRRLPLAAALLALAAPAPVSAAERPRFLTLVRANTYEFRDDANQAVVSVPVSLSAGARMDRIRATVVSVSLGQREDLALVDSFTAIPVGVAKGRGPQLRVEIDTETGLDPGTYNLIVDLRRTGNLVQRQRRRQRLRLALVHVAAMLKAPPAVVVERTGGFLFVDGKTEARPLRLQETSRKTQLSPVAVTQIDGPTGSEITNGELTFDELPGIAPGDHATAEPSLQGDFPLGSSTGTLQVDAPQLASPITVAFEVQRAVHWLWLVLAIAAGVFAGWLVRHLLAGVIARNQARQHGYALLDAIAVEHERRRDAGFRGQITGIRSDLEGALHTEREPAKIDEAVNHARAALQSAQADLDKECGAAQTALTALMATVHTRWTAPKVLSEAIGQQAGKLDEAARLLDAYDVTEAKAIVRDSRTAIESVLKEQVPPWAAAVRNLLADLDEARLPFPVMNEVRVARTEIDAALASTGIDGVAIDPDVVLKGVHAAETRRRRLLAECLARTGLAVTAVLDELNGFGGKAATDAVTTAERGLEQALSQGTASAADLSEIGERASAVVKALRTAIQEPVPKDEQATHARINAKMDTGRYVEAARLAVQAAPQATKDRILGGIPAVGADVAAVADAEPLVRGLLAGVETPAVPALVLQTGAARHNSAFDLTRARAASRAALADATVLRAFIVGVGVVLVGCGLFLPSFTGTFEQFLAAFLWGFAADVTSEGLYQLAKSSGSPSSPAPAGSTTQP